MSRPPIVFSFSFASRSMLWSSFSSLIDSSFSPVTAITRNRMVALNLSCFVSVAWRFTCNTMSGHFTFALFSAIHLSSCCTIFYNSFFLHLLAVLRCTFWRFHITGFHLFTFYFSPFIFLLFHVWSFYCNCFHDFIFSRREPPHETRNITSWFHTSGGGIPSDPSWPLRESSMWELLEQYMSWNLEKKRARRFFSFESLILITIRRAVTILVTTCELSIVNVRTQHQTVWVHHARAFRVKALWTNSTKIEF